MSIGPTLSNPDRIQTTDTPSTDSDSESGSFALRNAKWSFDPFNTRPCPQLFEDKWAADGWTPEE